MTCAEFGGPNKTGAAAFGPEDFARAAGVSAEILRKLRIYDEVLVDWNTRHNLISRSTVADRWRRHFLDSAQIHAALAPGAKTLVDLGSGAGFPGLVLAALGEPGGLQVTLVESIKKKAVFLSTAIEAMGLRHVAVIPERLESVRLSKPDAITARALASLPKLLDYAHEIAGQNTVCYFLKGQDVGAELTEATKYWNIEVDQLPSLTAPEARLLIVRRFAPKDRKGRRVKPR